MHLPSLALLSRVAWATLDISVPTVVDGYRSSVDPRRCDARLDRWSKRILELSGVELEVHGREHLEPGKSYVLMSNHQSYYDIPVLFQALRIPIRMVAKAELFNTPIWGRAMHAAGFIAVDRKRGREALTRLMQARERLERDQTSLWIAPEGTRSYDGTLLPFKRGGFQLALVTGLPIVPISINGTVRVHARSSEVIHRGERVQVTIAEPIDPASYGRKRMDELIARVGEIIAAPLGVAPPPKDAPEKDPSEGNGKAAGNGQAASIATSQGASAIN
jgi:1-acyl-sn-glycerol-3-phosphate acyltransferase